MAFGPPEQPIDFLALVVIPFPVFIQNGVSTPALQAIFRRNIVSGSIHSPLAAAAAAAGSHGDSCYSF
jgi:hypothetical protein